MFRVCKIVFRVCKGRSILLRMSPAVPAPASPPIHPAGHLKPRGGPKTVSGEKSPFRRSAACSQCALARPGGVGLPETTRQRPPQRVTVAAFSRELCTVSTRVDQHLTFNFCASLASVAGATPEVTLPQFQRLMSNSSTPRCAPRALPLRFPFFLCCCLRFLAHVLANSKVCEQSHE